MTDNTEVANILIEGTGLTATELLTLIQMMDNGSDVDAIADEFDRTEEDAQRLMVRTDKAAIASGGSSFLKSALTALAESERDQPEPASSPRLAPSKEPSNVAVPAVANLKRTSLGLRDTLFDAMDRLIEGQISSNEAKAVAGLADAICKTVKLEMDAAKMRSAGDGEDLQVLRLGSGGEAD